MSNFKIEFWNRRPWTSFKVRFSITFLSCRTCFGISFELWIWLIIWALTFGILLRSICFGKKVKKWKLRLRRQMSWFPSSSWGKGMKSLPPLPFKKQWSTLGISWSEDVDVVEGYAGLVGRSIGFQEVIRLRWGWLVRQLSNQTCILHKFPSFLRPKPSMRWRR